MGRWLGHPSTSTGRRYPPFVSKETRRKAIEELPNSFTGSRIFGDSDLRCFSVENIIKLRQWWLRWAGNRVTFHQDQECALISGAQIVPRKSDVAAPHPFRSSRSGKLSPSNDRIILLLVAFLALP
jgi:hypothetical protein